MPQAAAAPQQQDRPQTSAEKQITRMQLLEKQRGELMKQIASNREYLRLMADNEELDQEQEDFLEDFYPTKEKGQQRSAEEIERTRKVKAAARAGATTIEENRKLSAKVDAKDADDDDDDE